MTGYEGLRSTAAWFDLSDRGAIRMSGEDRTRLLHAMTTNNIEALTSGQGCYTFFLNAQGRILADANVFHRGDSYLLDTEPETGKKVYEHLDKYIIADDVTLSDETAQWARIAVEGPASTLKMEQLGAPVPSHPTQNQPWSSVSWADGFVCDVSLTGQPGYRIFVPAAQKLELIEALRAADTPEASASDVKIVRLENGKPRYGEDITERYLVQETNQMHAVSFAKGCYLGQEIVERVRSRAQIHRVLTPVRIQSRVVPEPGTKLAVDDKDIAEITSAAFSPSLGEVVALAYVRIEQTEAKKPMLLRGTEAVVTAYIP